MFGDSDFLKAIRLEHPDVIPTTVGLLPAFWIRRGRDAEELVKAFPQFFPQGYSVDSPLNPYPLQISLVYNRSILGTRPLSEFF